MLPSFCLPSLSTTCHAHSGHGLSLVSAAGFHVRQPVSLDTNNFCTLLLLACCSLCSSCLLLPLHQLHQQPPSVFYLAHSTRAHVAQATPPPHDPLPRHATTNLNTSAVRSHRNDHHRHAFCMHAFCHSHGTLDIHPWLGVQTRFAGPPARARHRRACQVFGSLSRLREIP